MASERSQLNSLVVVPIQLDLLSSSHSLPGASKYFISQEMIQNVCNVDNEFLVGQGIYRKERKKILIYLKDHRLVQYVKSPWAFNLS